ncbi:MAG: AAA family ATPase [Alphaproteobacteria bacterium]
MLAIVPPASATFEEVHRRYDGNWRAVLSSHGIDERLLDGRHHPCPGCGGKDRFRFDDEAGRGTWICGQGGGTPVAGDALDLLVHAGRAQDPLGALRLVSASHMPVAPRSRSATLKTDYTYLLADGSLALTVTRTEYDDGSKTFSQKTARGLKPSEDEAFTPVPYNLPGIASNPDATVYVTEGEKCADTLIGLGLVATCNAGGAGNWRSEMNEHLVGRDVVILPDNDDAGEKHLRKLINELEDVAASIRVCRLADLPPKGDVVDWLNAGNDLSDLKRALDDAEPIGDGLGMTLAQLARLDVVTPDPVHEHLPHGFTLLAGAPKAGKSTFMEWLAFEVSADAPVLYLALEYSLPMLRARFAWMGSQPNVRLFFEGQFPKMDDGGSEQLERLLKKLRPPLTVIDTLAKVKRPGSERGYEGEIEAMAELKELFAAHDLSCVCIHHTRKASIHDNADDPFDRILGSTALAAVPDNLMVLLNEGEHTVLHTKGRLVSSSVRRFRLNDHRFELYESAGAELRGKADRQADILEMLAEGPALQTEMADELGMDPGNLSRMCRTLAAGGKIKRDGRGKPWRLVEKDLF